LKDSLSSGFNIIL